MEYVEVLLPVPIQSSFTYRLPEGMQVVCGQRVVVPFGRKKYYTGIVTGFLPKAPAGFEIKEVMLAMPDAGPVVRHPQLKFWQWIADYYLCTPGEVFKAAVPSGLKVESESIIMPMPDFEEDEASQLSPREREVMGALLSGGKMSIEQLQKVLASSKSISRVVDSLLRRKAVSVSENLVERYRAKKITYLRIAAPRGDDAALHQAFDKLRSGSKQEKAFITLLDLSGFMRKGEAMKEVTRADVMERADVTSDIIKAMEKKGIVETYVREVNRFSFFGIPTGTLPRLSEPQDKCLAEIHRSWLDKNVTLLHGVTSSGKTEIYIHLIDYVLRQGRQVLYLVPEIALTTQLTRRLQLVFGDKVIVYHSRFTDNERVDIWKRLLSDTSPCVVIGARSSVFMPFSSLGLVIVDEEHEPSFKQQDPAPRYNARDCAIVLASMHGAKTLLGSATPSIETYHKALNGRYGLVSLTTRHDDRPLPQMKVVDLTAARKEYRMRGPLATGTCEMVADALEKGEQAILFLNRRGYAPMARCKMCGHIPKCDACDVSLTYHSHIDKLVCHYCGRPYQVPEICPACKEPAMEVVGYGTERIEEEIQGLFPQAAIARMDLDSTRSKDAYETIIENFSKGKEQILIGTQMVTKGLDFDKVSVVGVINADTIINFPDFRSSERAFNMIEQVAGRAGRGVDGGYVAVQTFNPSHPLFPFLVNHDYQGFYQYEIAQREQFVYPPFSRVIYLYVKHRDRNAVSAIAHDFARRLYDLLGNRVKGPDEPAIARVQNMYIRRIMLKIEVNASISKVKELLTQVRVAMANAKLLSGAVIYADVDPV